MMKEIIYFNGQEVSIDKLKCIMLRSFKEANMFNSVISNVMISRLEERRSIFEFHLGLVHNDFKKIIPLFENLSSNIIEFEISLLETYLDTHGIKKEFYEEMVKYTQNDRICHFTYGIKNEKSILQNILLRYDLREIIMKSFYWNDTKQGVIFWLDHYYQFHHWLAEQNVNEQIYH